MIGAASTSILGIEIPSASPLFLGGVGLHVLFGLIAVIGGAGAMLSRKGSARHRTFGRIYYWSLMVLFVSATGLAIARWAEDYHLFMLGALAFGVATLGRNAVTCKWASWTRLHVAGMGSSSILMLTAFYVDNGKNLPLWRDLPPLAFWVLPALLGGPIVIWALLRHPVVLRYRASR